MSKNKKILVTSFVLGTLFSVNNISAMNKKNSIIDDEYFQKQNDELHINDSSYLKRIGLEKSFLNNKHENYNNSEKNKKIEKKPKEINKMVANFDKIQQEHFSSELNELTSPKQPKNLDYLPLLIDKDEFKDEIEYEYNDSQESKLEENEEIKNLLSSTTNFYNENEIKKIKNLLKSIKNYNNDNIKYDDRITTKIKNDFTTLEDIKNNLENPFLNKISAYNKSVLNEIFTYEKYEEFLFEIKDHIKEFKDSEKNNKNKELMNKISELNNEFENVNYLVQDKKITKINTAANEIYKKCCESVNLEQIKYYEELLKYFKDNLDKLIWYENLDEKKSENLTEKIGKLCETFLNLNSCIEDKKIEIIINNNDLYKKLTVKLPEYNEFLNNYDIPKMYEYAIDSFDDYKCTIDKCDKYIQKLKDETKKINTIKTLTEHTKNLFADKLKSLKTVENEELLQNFSKKIENQYCEIDDMSARQIKELGMMEDYSKRIKTANELLKNVNQKLNEIKTKYKIVDKNQIEKYKNSLSEFKKSLEQSLKSLFRLNIPAIKDKIENMISRIDECVGELISHKNKNKKQCKELNEEI